METHQATLPQDIWELFDISWSPDEEGLDGYLKRALERCAAWFGASGASIFLRDDNTDSFVLASKTGIDAKAPKGARIVAGQGIAGTGIQTGEPMLIGDPAEHPTLSDREVNRRTDVRSALVVPLLNPDRSPVGVMNLSRPANAEPFQEIDLRHASLLARYISLAVTNARIFAETYGQVALANTAKSKLQAVIAGLGVAVVVLHPDGTISHRNAEAERLLGEAGENNGASRFAGAPDELREALDRALAAALEGKSVRLRAREANTGRAWSIVCTPTAGGGATAAVEEVTEEERALAERARVNRLAEIGQMSAAIAHEIRNPLTGIRSAAQMIQESPEQAPEFAKVIEEEAQKLNSLCDQFLEFAKPLAVKSERIDLKELADHIVAQHAADFKKSKVDLQVIEQAQGAFIQGDRLKVEQVLRNLLLNALQATSPGGNVRVVVAASGYIVADDGCGMDESTVQKLFTPFFTTKAQGTGLGLSTVRKIVEAHGGRVEVNSAPGVGTRFEVCLEPDPWKDQRVAA